MNMYSKFNKWFLCEVTGGTSQFSDDETLFFDKEYIDILGKDLRYVISLHTISKCIYHGYLIEIVNKKGGVIYSKVFLFKDYLDSVEEKFMRFPYIFEPIDNELRFHYSPTSNSVNYMRYKMKEFIRLFEE